MEKIIQSALVGMATYLILSGLKDAHENYRQNKYYNDVFQANQPNSNNQINS